MREYDLLPIREWIMQEFICFHFFWGYGKASLATQWEIALFLCAELLLPPLQIWKQIWFFFFSQVKAMQFLCLLSVSYGSFFWIHRIHFSLLIFCFQRLWIPLQKQWAAGFWWTVVMFMEHYERDTSRKLKDCIVGLISVLSRKSQEEERKTKVRDLYFWHYLLFS